MKVGFIHATTTAVEPINAAFRDICPDVERYHFMDTGLLTMLEQAGELTPEIIRRFSRLVDLAAETEVDIIQLTCSAFNDLTAILQPLHRAKLFRSDEAMLDEALEYERIGLVSTVRETPIALSNYLRTKNPDVHIESIVEPGLIKYLFEGKQEIHDQKVGDMVREIEGKVDVIVLSQYSMEHVAEQIESSVPILTAPRASAKRCLEYFQTEKSKSRQNSEIEERI